MGTIDFILFLILVGCCCFQNIRANPIDISRINCTGGSHKELWPFDEGYHGAVEKLIGLSTEYNVQLVPFGYDSHIQLLELISGAENSTAAVYTKAPLDADALKETQGKLYYSLKCANNIQYTRIFTINDLNDNSPVFDANAYTVTISETLSVDSSVIKVHAEDADLTSQNNRFTYSIMPPVPSAFMVRSDGTIILKTRLNYNTANHYSFTVEARDIDNLSDTASVTITVEDFDNMNPYFHHTVYSAVIRENETGQFLSIMPEAIEAKDGDTGINQPIVYTISAVSPSKYTSHFNINPVSGIITVVTQLDREEVGMVTVHIKASQNDNSSKTAEATVSVKIEEVNDNSPEFDQSSYSANILENSPVGSFVLRARITDRDEAGFSNGHFILNSDTFNINKQGTVSLSSNATLDREDQANYILQVVAVDSPTNGLSATAQLNITILDINDNNPQFLPLSDPILLPEGLYSPGAPGEVCRITATDIDQGTNAMVTLSLSNPSSLFQFREDGTLLATGPLDREKKEAYDLVIVASDQGMPQRKNITGIIVTVTDVNDNEPQFSQETYAKELLVKDAKEGDLVLTLSAMDKDTGNNALIAYSFSAGSSLLSLHNETGEITLTSDLSNIAEDTLLKLTALARDQGQPPRSSTATVLVSLFTTSYTLGVDFSSPAYNFSVAENEPESTLVGMVKALTGNSSVQVTYTLRSHRDLFIVDKQGRISTSQALDKETQEWYTMEVEAVDSRTPPNTAVAMVTVWVEDVNEAPKFSHTSYSTVIFSIAPYKHPVVRVKATDPDSGENGQLEYSLEEPSSLFDVERSSGQVYVLSVEGQKGQVSLHVKATDPLGLSATIEVEVMIQDSASSDAVVISLNQPVNIVDREILEMERSLGQALGWTVKVSSVRSANTFGGGVRSSRDSAKTYVTFITMDTGNTMVPSEEVERKLESESEAVQVQLEKVFGEGLEYTVEKGPGIPDSTDQTIAIVLGVLPALIIVGLVVMGVVTSVKFKKLKSRNEDSIGITGIDHPSQEHRNVDSETGSSQQALSRSGSILIYGQF